MSMATAVAQPVERENYLNKHYGVGSWLFTTDHKRIALLYLMSITFFFFIGGFFALMIRLELLTPAGDILGKFAASRRIHAPRKPTPALPSPSPNRSHRA